MRSKEVSGAIENLNKDILVDECWKNHDIDEIFKEHHILSLKTVLAYIEQLEKMIPTPSNEVPVEYQTLILVDKRDAVMKSEIRDKIKELELEEDRIYKLDYELEREKAIDVVISKRVLLESLLGE